MLTNSDSIIADTSCFILLSKINEIGLLRLPGRNVLTTPIITQEFKKSLPEWIEIINPPEDKIEIIIRMNLDRGEASAMALAMNIERSILIIDDLKARKVADKLNLRYSVTLGLILRAKQEGILPAIKPVIEKIDTTDFRIDKHLLQSVLIQAGE